MLKKFIYKKTFLSSQIVPITFLAVIATLSDYASSIFSTIIAGGRFSDMGLIVVGLFSPISTFTIFVCDMLFGGAVYLRQVCVSEGDEEKGSRYVGIALISALTIGILVTAMLFFFTNQYLALFSLSDEVLEYAIPYMKAISPFSLLSMLTYLGYEFLFRLNEKKAAYLINFVCFFGVIVFGIIFTKAFGITGMAYASVLTNFITFLISAFIVLKHKDSVSFSFKFKKKEVMELFKFGFSYSQDSFYYPIFSAFMMMFVSRMLGEACLAVIAIIDCFSSICSVFYGVSYASQNQLGIFLGEKNSIGIKRTLDISLKLQVLISLIVILVTMVFAVPIANYFGMEDLYKAETITAIRLYAGSFIFLAFLCFMGDYYSSIEKYVTTVVLYFSRTIIAGLGISILLGLSFGNLGIYLGRGLEAPFALLLTYIFIRCRYKTKDIFFLDESRDIFSIEYDVKQEDILRARNELEEELVKRHIPEALRLKLMLSLEDVSGLILEINEKKVYAQCDLFFEEDYIEMVIRDSGRIIDLSDFDRKPESVLAYFVSNMLESFKYVKHLDASKTNRLTFRFPLRNNSSKV